MAILPHTQLSAGRKPALLIVDAMVGFTDATSPLGCESARELAVIARLLDAFREQALPVIYTINAYIHPSEATVFRAKIPLLDLLVDGSPLAAISPGVEPREGEAVLRKGVPSAFFDSSLRDLLVNQGVDSVFICGFSTSGCVRATAVDALQSNFLVVVVADGCGDRDSAAHEANLRDIGLKYGDVLDLDQALARLGNQVPRRDANPGN